MRICFNLDPSRLLRWHLWVAAVLAGRPGNEVFCRYSAARRPIPSACRLLLDVERMIYGASQGDAAAPMESALRALPPCASDAPDLTIDFAGEDDGTLDGRVLTPLFNGIPSEIGVIAALTEGHDLVVELHDNAHPRRPWTARPASADRAVVSACLDGALSCAVALIGKAVREGAPLAPETDAFPSARKAQFAVSASAIARVASAVTWKAARLLDKLVTGGSAWGIGWRFAGSSSLIKDGKACFRVLSGGSHSYLADPFPFRYRERDYIFFEQYPYATGRGCIAVAAVERNGAVGEPRVVLQEPHHLSYPHLFEREGQVWMIPEAGESGNVDLYRAVDFPYRWTREARLAEGLEAYDVTPLVRDDGIWFFACLRLGKSTSWDILGLYRTDSLTGAWTPHAHNPVLIDATLSRPAGAFVREGGHTLRPVQDCGRVYGGGVTFCRLDALNGTTFEQTPVGRIWSGPFGCHTYNRNAGIEVIDLFGKFNGPQEVAAAYCPLSASARRILPLAQDIVFVPGDGREQVADDPA
jgi:hypothetical protein